MHLTDNELTRYVFTDPPLPLFEKVINHCHECEQCREILYIVLTNKENILKGFKKGAGND